MELGMSKQENTQTSSPQTNQTSRSGLSKPRNSATTSGTTNVAPISANVNKGFRVPERADPNRQRRAVVLVSGDWKQGKTHFAFTAPSINFFQSLDMGTEGVIEKFEPTGIRLAEYSLTVQPGQGSEQEVAVAADVVWNQFTSDFYQALNDPTCRTITWDTESEAWELLRLARFGVLNPKTGRDRGNVWGPVNAEMLGLIRAALASDKNFVMLEKVKDVYKDDKKTGKRERKGFGDAAFQAQIVATARREGAEFFLDITDCRGVPEMNGITIPNDYGTLMEMMK